MFTDKIITTSTTLERNKAQQQAAKDQRNSHMTTLERENEKNARNRGDAHTKVEMRNKEDAVSKPERTKNKNSNEMLNVRVSSPPDVVIIKDGGDMYSVKNEKAELQKRESDSGAKKGMKFGIRVLPPNIPDDGTLSKSPKFENVKMPGTENSSIVAEIRSIDEVDKNFSPSTTTTTENEDTQHKQKTAPVVAKRREKPAAPVPNARTPPQVTLPPRSDHSEKTTSNNIEFNRNDDLNSSGIKRDAQGIPQELPQHMMEAAMYARNNRKPQLDTITNDSSSKQDSKKSNLDAQAKLDKNSKKSKGKAPSPPEANSFRSNESDASYDTDVTQDTIKQKDMNFTDNFVDRSGHFIENEKSHTVANRSDDMILNKGMMNTSTPKVEKVVKRLRPDIPTLQKQDETTSDDVISYTKKEISDSMNNFFEDSKSNVSSTFDVNSELSLNQDSFSTNLSSDSPITIALNSSDITIHSSPINDPEGKNQEIDDNERKASSLGDLSRLEKTEKTSNVKKPSQGTLERAQSLDISTEESKVIASDKNITPKKRKSNSVFDPNYYGDDAPIDSSESVDQILIHSKEPRLSLNIGNVSMDGLNTFQKNRLKKSTEWGNLEDAIISKKGIAGSSHSSSSDMNSSIEKLNDPTSLTNGVFTASDEKSKKLNGEINKFRQMMSESIDDTSNDTFTIRSKEVPTTITMETFVNDFNKADVFKTTDTTLPFNSIPNEQQTSQRKPEISSRSKIALDNSLTKPSFEIGAYVSDAYKTEPTVISSSGKLSPKMEEKLTLIYDTNIPDDIKVSRHTLVSSLERPKSDLMKKLLAQNQVLTSLETPVVKSGTDVTVDPEHGEQNINFQTGAPHGSINFIDSDKSGENRTNLTTFTMLNQPDIVNLKIKQNSTADLGAQNEHLYPESDFVSNINIGTLPKSETSKINFNLDMNATPQDKQQSRNFFSTTENIVTITTDGSQPSSIITIEGDPSVHSKVENFRNSIEIKSDAEKQTSDSAKNTDITQTEQSLYNEIISELQKSKNILQDGSNNQQPTISSSKTYLIDGGTTEMVTSSTPFVVDTESTMLPTQKTVTVNVTEDEHGNKIVTQNIEETRNRLVTITTTTPIEIEQYTFGVIKNPTEADIKRIEEMENDPNIDARLIADIEKQNPHMKLIPGDNMHTNTDTMMVNTNMSEDEARELLARFRENPHLIMSSHNAVKHPEMVVKETKMIVEESNKTFDGTPLIKMTQASYKYNLDDNTNKPAVKIVKMIESNSDFSQENQMETHKKPSENFSVSSNVHSKETSGYSLHDSPPKDYITEIEVRTPGAEKYKAENTYYNEKNTSGIDASFMDDFLSNERDFSAIEKTDSDNFDRRKSESSDSTEYKKESNDDQRAKRHSDFDLPRNTHIKFRTATYEPQNPAPNKLSFSSEKRLSQIEILKSNFEKGNLENASSVSSSNKPTLLTKPSNIPIKLPEKPVPPQKSAVVSPSKIPVLNSQNQKSASQENLLDKNISFQKTSPHSKLSPSLGNISITSIKSSSRNPSGK